jgi:hypothetical protein
MEHAVGMQIVVGFLTDMVQFPLTCFELMNMQRSTDITYIYRQGTMRKLPRG